ncbi:unnamed protein product [Prunus brigantina]
MQPLTTHAWNLQPETLFCNIEKNQFTQSLVGVARGSWGIWARNEVYLVDTEILGPISSLCKSTRKVQTYCLLIIDES